MWWRFWGGVMGGGGQYTSHHQRLAKLKEYYCLN